MKIHWSIADQEIMFAIEHTGQMTRLPRIHVPFLDIKYFMWGDFSITETLRRTYERLKALAKA